MSRKILRSPEMLKKFNTQSEIEDDSRFEEMEYDLYDHDSEESPMEYELRHFHD